MKTICIFLAEGFEEMEAMFPLDVMRRGGLNVKTVSVTGEKTVVSSHQVPIVADMLFEDLKEEDVEMVVLRVDFRERQIWMLMQDSTS